MTAMELAVIYGVVVALEENGIDRSLALRLTKNEHLTPEIRQGIQEYIDAGIPLDVINSGLRTHPLGKKAFGSEWTDMTMKLFR